MIEVAGSELLMRIDRWRTVRDPVAATRQKIVSLSIPEPNTGCWLWLGCYSKGYGYVRINGRMRIASRVSFAAFKADPAGLDVCHHCDNPICVNPDHLFAGTTSDNMQDQIRKGRGKAKIRDADLPAVKASKLRGRELARRYGVSESLISMIRSGRHRSVA
jgi:hypothetical protein